jgi:uncharacterized membrane protein YphA (DoxX/SURF4 family)
MNTFIPLLGRLCLAVLFARSVVTKIMDPDELAARLIDKGMPLPEILGVVVIAFELIGTLLLIVGWKTRYAALLLILWLIPVTIIMHPPDDPKQIGAFLKNLGLIGGLLFLYRSDAGEWSVDGLQKKR